MGALSKREQTGLAGGDDGGLHGTLQYYYLAVADTHLSERARSLNINSFPLGAGHTCPPAQLVYNVVHIVVLVVVQYSEEITGPLKSRPAKM